MPPLDAKLPEIIHEQAGSPVEAVEAEERLFEALAGEVLYVDPYFDPNTLDRPACFRSVDKVRFLTSKVEDPDGTLNISLEKFRKWHPNVEIRRLAGEELHARYIIAGDRLVMLGHSTKDAGRRESLIADLGSAGRPEMLDDLRQQFDDRWQKATPIP